MLPNCLIVVAEKAGITSLAEMLGSHPDVFMSGLKQSRFFSDHNRDWHEFLFRSVDGQRMVGEASPAYTRASESPDTSVRIRNPLDDGRYLYIVLSPVDRVVPHYRHAIFNRWLPNGATFNAALEEMAGLMDCSRYLPSGMRGHWCGAIFTDA